MNNTEKLHAISKAAREVRQWRERQIKDCGGDHGIDKDTLLSFLDYINDVLSEGD